ncbi:MAG: hypothetical protein K6A71_12335 [Lachnospiraceae bacterium]|nr:hypothetical protein [Lachnospiraceae bacterium]
MRELYVDNSDVKASEALALADKYINEEGIEGKTAIHMRLITEETLGMLREMTGDYEALLKFDKDDSGYHVILAVKTDMNLDKKRELLSVSTTGKNAAAVGFMAKVKEVYESAMAGYDETVKLAREYGGYVNYGYMDGTQSISDPLALGYLSFWSLSNYRSALGDARDDSDDARDEWDELEKSIVASIAKDVVVGVKKNTVEMRITL